MKTCPNCKETKTLEEFDNNAAKKDGKASSCKICKKLYQDAWYRNNKKEHVKKAMLTKKQAILETRRKVWRYLETHTCVDCPETDIVTLEFDHVRGNKLAAISELVKLPASWSTIEQEIAKCEVRCANCHKKKTARERG